MTQYKRDGLTVRCADPVVVAMSTPGETRWGYYQFPTISRLPDGKLLVTFNDRPDSDKAYGTPGPAYTSADGGQTWAKWNSPDPLLTVSHSVISPVDDGEFLCVPVAPSLDIVKQQIKLPALTGKMDVYGEVLLYKLSECSGEVQSQISSLVGTRWLPKAGKWEHETVRWDAQHALVRMRPFEKVFPKPFLDNRLVEAGGLWLYPGFHQQYLLPDGSCPKNYACWCMASADNGRSWQRHGLIAYDTTGEMMMGEPCLLPTADGHLACVIRCSDQKQRPTLITYSADQGRTWSAPRPLSKFGVMPQALLLRNGVSVVSYGRPGVQMMLSPDGLAQKWSEPIDIVPGDPKNIDANSCGYTRLLPVSDSAFLMVYSDFRYPMEHDQHGKAILVRQIEISH